MDETQSQCRRLVTSQKWSEIESTNGLLDDILCHLPVRTIRSFKTVNKFWYRSVSNKLFAEKKLAQSMKNPSFITCPAMGYSMKLFTMMPGSFKRSYLTTLNPPERCKTQHMYTISSFNGLICCINYLIGQDVRFFDLQIWISNPSTGEILLLPQGSPSFNFKPGVGVAYGSDSYKVFRVFGTEKKIPKENVFEEVSFVHECEVYSSTTGAWENIGPVPCVPMLVDFYCPFRSCHVYAEGRVCWLSSFDDEGKILSIDMFGRCEELKLPLYEYQDGHSDEDGITEATYLINLNGSLAVVIRHTYDMDIWRRNEACTEKNGWEEVCTVNTMFKDTDVVTIVTSSKNKILFMTEKHWWSYDMETNKWKKKKERRDEFINPCLFPFTESLLRCNGTLDM